jgi:hypothetical protein
MAITLRYVPALTGDGNCFTARMDGDVILISAQLRRTDVSRVLPMILPAWLDARGRTRPKHYDRDIFALYRRDDGAFSMPGVSFGPGDREELSFIDVPHEVSQFW